MNVSAKNIDDFNLLSRLRDGDDAAYKTIYESHWKILFQICFKVLRNEDDAMDICQNIFLSLWENRHTIKLETNLRAYLYGAAKFKIANLIKRGRAKVVFLDDITFPEALSDQNLSIEVRELRQIIDQAIDQLPDKCREVFKLSRFDYLSHKEIADKLNISEKTVDDHISRAIKKLKGPLSRLSAILISII